MTKIVSRITFAMLSTASAAVVVMFANPANAVATGQAPAQPATLAATTTFAAPLHG